MERIKVLIVDDHALVRRGLRVVLDGAQDIELVGEAVDGEEGVEWAMALRPDVVLMDVQMPRCNGLKQRVGFRTSSPKQGCSC